MRQVYTLYNLVRWNIFYLTSYQPKISLCWRSKLNMAYISCNFVQLCLCFLQLLSLKGSFSSHQFAPPVLFSASYLGNLYLDLTWYQHILNSWWEVMSCSAYLPHNICHLCSVNKRMSADCWANMHWWHNILHVIFMLQDVDGGHLKIITGEIEMIVVLGVEVHCHYLDLTAPSTWIYIPSYQHDNSHRAADVQIGTHLYNSHLLWTL